jgi:hypothetical protein
MPTASRLSSGATSLERSKRPETKTKPHPKPAREERWWFPLGSITRVGEGVFRWHCLSTEPESGHLFIFSGRLELHNGIGILQDEDADEGDIDEDPMQSWYDNLPTFPYVHLFYDAAAEVEDSDMGPWFCIHANYGRTRETVETKCSDDLDTPS